MLEVAIVSLKCALRDDYPEFKEFFDEKPWEPKEEEAAADGEQTESAEAADVESVEAAEAVDSEQNEAKEENGTATDAENVEDVKNDA